MVKLKNRKMRVAIQGLATSFHEVAAHTYFPDKPQILECLTFYRVCEALQQGEVEYAVMAIENSIAGSILPNYFLLQQFHFSIVGELYLPIHMHLLALPGTTLSKIRVVESHPMALRQCSDYLQKLEGIEIRESDDTALSAKRVRELKLKDTAAIANEWAAKKYGLRVLDKRIETHKKNFTRFLVLSRQRAHVPEANKASLSFEVAHEVGSLADALLTFKHHRLNLLKIQSIPVIGRPTEYSIHVDVEWKVKKQYDEAMRTLLGQVRNLNVLGEYKKATIQF